MIDLHSDTLDTGAHGFVCKEEETDYLLEGVTAVSDGHQYMSPLATECHRHYQQFGPQSLTPRQEKILRDAGEL